MFREPNVKLSGRQQRGAPDSGRKMGRRPCARWPAGRAVGVPLERRVRPRAMLSEQGILHEEMLPRPGCAEYAKLEWRCLGLTRLGLPNRMPRSTRGCWLGAPVLAMGLGHTLWAAVDVACRELADAALTVARVADGSRRDSRWPNIGRKTMACAMHGNCRALAIGARLIGRRDCCDRNPWIHRLEQSHGVPGAFRGRTFELIPIRVQDGRKYGILRVVQNDWRSSWHGLD